jgi:hypothetical protein
VAWTSWCYVRRVRSEQCETSLLAGISRRGHGPRTGRPQFGCSTRFRTADGDGADLDEPAGHQQLSNRLPYCALSHNRRTAGMRNTRYRIAAPLVRYAAANSQQQLRQAHLPAGSVIPYRYFRIASRQGVDRQKRYGQSMDWLQAAAWGVMGGLTSGLVALMAQVTAANFRWPWKREEVGPRLVVSVCGLVVGAIVAAAAHKQMSGEWPAFIMGVCAPSVIRRVIAGVEVQPRIEQRPGTGRSPSAVQISELSREEQASEAEG